MSSGAPEPAAADFEESPQVKIRRLEGLLADTRRHGAKATRQLHRALARELRAERQRAQDAERRAEHAEAQLARARARAREAERELEALRASATVRAGRAVAAVPARLRKLARRRD